MVAVLLADVASEGRDIVIGMLIVGLVIIAVIAVGELWSYFTHRGDFSE